MSKGLNVAARSVLFRQLAAAYRRRIPLQNVVTILSQDEEWFGRSRQAKDLVQQIGDVPQFRRKSMSLNVCSWPVGAKLEFLNCGRWWVAAIKDRAILGFAMPVPDLRRLLPVATVWLWNA